MLKGAALMDIALVRTCTFIDSKGPFTRTVKITASSYVFTLPNTETDKKWVV